MLDSAEIVFTVTCAVEAAPIIAGNMFTIVVFWTQRSHLERTCFLFINLAIFHVVWTKVQCKKSARHLFETKRLAIALSRVQEVVYGKTYFSTK